MRAFPEKLLLLLIALPLTALFVLAQTVPRAGDFDTGFGSGGKVITAFGEQDDAFGVVIQPDGKIVIVGGSLQNGGGTDVGFALARYNPDGSLDTAFGNNGKVITNPTPLRIDQAHAVTLQTDSKIIAAGTVDSHWAVIRYNSDGVVDTSFGTEENGLVVFGLKGFIISVAVQSDGKIVFSGLSSSGLVVVRLLENGSLDNGFGSGGKVQISLLPGIAQDVLLQPDGKIVLVGLVDDNNGGDSAVIARLDVDGTFDASFGTDGKVFTRFSGSSARFEGGCLQSDGSVVLVGNVLRIGRTTHDGFVARFDSHGVLDESFGEVGLLLDKNEFGLDVKVQTDGKIIVGGVAFINKESASDGDFLLARYSADGHLDSSFGIGGKVISDFSNTSDFPRCVVLQPDGKIILAGSTRDSRLIRFITTRYLDKSPSPVILDATINGKKVNISGQNFDRDAKVLMNGVEQKTKYKSITNLQCKKLGKKIKDGDKLQVRNPDGSLSAEFIFSTG